MKQILIGKIVNTHGIRGELKVISQTDFPEIRMAAHAQVKIKDETFEVLKMRFHKSFCLLTLKGFDNINQVLYLVNNYIYALEAKPIELASDEIHLLQIKNYQVFDQTTNQIVGTVKNIIKNPGNDLLEVEKPNQKTFLIPIVKQFIKETNDQDKIINVALIEGLNNEN